MLRRYFKKETTRKNRASTGKDSPDDLLNIKVPVVLTDDWGMRFIRYPADSETPEVIISKDFYKPELLAIKKLVHQNDTIVDVGANIGLFSVFLSKEIGPRGNLYAFEPVFETYNKMLENLVLNRCDNVSSYQQAISKKPGKATMNIFPDGYGAWNTFGKPQFGKIKPISTEKVLMVTLDGFAKNNKLKAIDFLKVDVEGFEIDVFKGAEDLLKKKRIKYLTFEVSEIPLKGANKEASEVFDFLESYGYLTYEFDPKSNKFKGPIENSTAFYQNYYASMSDMRKL